MTDNQPDEPSRRFAPGLFLLALLAAAPAAPSRHPVAPLRFRITEVASAFCEWSGEATFTCRHVRTPFAIEVRFDSLPERIVVMKLDGRVVERSERPFTSNFAPGTVKPGTHRLNFAIRQDGEETFSRSFTIEVSPPRTESELPPPVVFFTSPVDGGRLVGKQIIQVQAYNPKNLHREVDQVTIELDGSPLQVEQRGSYQAEWEATPGPHTIVATAVGSRGQVARAELNVLGLARQTLIDERRLLLSAETKILSFHVPEDTRTLHLSARFEATFPSQGEVTVALIEGADEHRLISMRAATGRLIPLERDFPQPKPGLWELRLSASGGGLLEMRDIVATVDLP